MALECFICEKILSSQLTSENQLCFFRFGQNKNENCLSSLYWSSGFLHNFSHSQKTYTIMGAYRLVVKATLEGLTDLEPVDSPSSPFEYTFEIKCLSCHEKHDKEVTINLYEKHEVQDTKGEQNFVFRCKQCKRQHHASIARTKNSITIEDNGKYVTILDIDARGIEPVSFIPNGIFKAKGAETTTKFEEIELDEGEYFDYDDKAGAEVSITDVKWDIVR